jgi:4-amino-4-deoxy-L-arabinose transferase-like glycosyltransferase
MSSARLARLGLVALLGLAAANFLWQLGSSSYYVDEVLAVNVALHPLSGLLHAIDTGEISPPAYFAFLHEWAGHIGSGPAWVMRLPSAICGVALVGAVYWLASLLCERRAVAYAAAALTALSPFVLQYAQLAQEYVFVMLSSTVAVAAAIEALRREGPRRPLWLLGAWAAAVLALSLHYTAGLLMLVLCVWVASRKGFPQRWRAAFVGGSVLAGAALIPVLLRQHQAIPARNGVAASAGVTTTTVQRIFETPLDGRVDALRLLGVIVTVFALAWLLAGRVQLVRERLLLAAIAAGIPLVLFALSVFGGHLMLTRYAAVAAPFMIVAIAAAIVGARPRPLGALIAVGALVVVLAGLIASHRAQGFYFDARGVDGYVRSHLRPGDAVLATDEPGSEIPLAYYGLRFDALGGATADALLRAHRQRLWVIDDLPANPPSIAELEDYMRTGFRGFEYAVARARIFPGVVPVGVVLVVPPERPGRGPVAGHSSAG